VVCCAVKHCLACIMQAFGVKLTATPPPPEDGELSPVSGLSPPPSPPPPQTPTAKPAALLTPSQSRYHSHRHSPERSRHHRSQGRDDDSRRNRSRSPGADDDRWGARSPGDRHHHPARHSDRAGRRSEPSDHKRRCWLRLPACNFIGCQYLLSWDCQCKSLERVSITDRRHSHDPTT
jgi:hypothetical protein